MKELHWYYPETLADAETLVRQENVLPHGGGTGLLLRNLTGVDSLIELSRLPLRSIKVVDHNVEIGSACTYADVVEKMAEIDPGHILIKCLHHSANTPLRNRITIGGSVAMFPPWSDLMGALITLDAMISLTGKNSGDYSVLEYIRDKNLRANSLITTVKFKLLPRKSAHYREIRTKSDMPTFNHTVLLNIEKNKIVDCRIITVGTVLKYTRLAEAETYLTNRRIENIDVAEIGKLVNLKFAGSHIDDPEYANIKAGIELGRMIQQMVRS
ncbi:MAG: FAD binding domain-containing protein [Candidatus Marinimicrobia bacterium]|nr:FAD binding domain-containing protein [Candidatus Neomarinimicrobiota bacterium]